MLTSFIVLLLVCLVAKTTAQYEVPEATVEAYYPKGFKVSIPDEEGIKLFAFHGKINEEMNGREAGTFSRDITKAKDGRWTFIDNSSKLKEGDILYYWTFVDYFDGERKLGYVKDDQSFTVKELLPKPGAVTTPQPSTPADPNVCNPTQTTINGKAACRGHLIFDSRFDQFGQNKDKFWTVERKFAGAPDYEFVMYDDSEKTLSVTNGHLVITPTLLDNIYGNNYVTSANGLDIGERCTGIRASAECYQRPQGWYIIPPVLSSQLSTKGKFSFKFGKIEVKAKLPKGDWLYPELYLNPEKEIYGPNYESGQIRIAYSAGNNMFNRRLEGGAILGNKAAARNYAIKVSDRNSPWADQFHTYTVLWEPERITLSVDGMVYGIIYPPERGFSSLTSNLQINYASRWKNTFAPLDEEMYILLGVGAGGHNFEDRSDGTKPWVNKEPISQKNFYKAKSSWLPTWGADSKLDIEYVKVWAL
ncbi:hypothetical protein GWI33_018085 [Rhynchophorus ferrugineus]|uniref:Uncharacterized protein n=1 Tax=Rhynchophorus ferrugineus TaxID=354439 RepID=A0A834HXT7_RHYFE|nr:hypothetical protein GWI33_018085 [Rhynchophorus ferrugineus]